MNSSENEGVWEDLVDEAQLDSLRDFDWLHAFIKSLSLRSPTQILVQDGEHRGTVAPDALPEISITIVGEDETKPGIQLHFQEVDEFGLLFSHEFEPFVSFERTGITFSIYGKGGPVIRCRSLRFRTLGLSGWEDSDLFPD